MSHTVHPTSTKLHRETKRNLDDSLTQTEPELEAPTSSQAIATKVSKGTALCPEDWKWLESLHNCPSQWDQHKVPHLNRDYLDALARVGTGLGQQKALPQLVRHVGMVQDMLEPEYYVEEYKGQSMHFRDLSSVEKSLSPDENDESKDNDGIGSGGGGGYSELGSQLAERQPLLVVPLPFLSDWSMPLFNPPTHSSLLSLSAKDDTVSSAVIPESPPTTTAMEDESTYCSRKRDRHLLSPCSEQGDKKSSKHDLDEIEQSDTLGRRRKQEAPALTMASSSSSSSLGGMVHGQESDWWPAGCCESGVHECPVLAKLAYDQYPTTRSHNHNTSGRNIKNDSRLRLNDVVELIGIISMDPWEAAQYHQNDPFATGLFDMDSCIPPPPSRLPRLHVLSYRRLDIDSVVANAEEKHLDLMTEKEDEESLHGKNIATVACNDNLKQKLQMLDVPSNSKNRLGTWVENCKVDPIMAKALFLTLISKAERVCDRKQKSLTSEQRSEMARAPQHALGCASLQLLCDRSSESNQLYRGLLRFLQQICPVVAGIDMVAGSPTVAKFVHGSPSKETGRLEPSPWQLPRGATLILHMPGQSKQTSSIASQLKPFLEELVGLHRLPYKFEGGMYVPFEADYRIIVVTWTSKSTRAIANDVSDISFPRCTLQLRVPSSPLPIRSDNLGTTNSTLHDSGTSPSFEQRTAFPRNSRTLRVLRNVLLCARASMENVPLSKSVLDQAQEDFLQRRAKGRGSQHSKRTTSLKSTLPPPEEGDFHRWLTLTRLFTRARGLYTTTSSPPAPIPSDTSTVDDWQAALRLDDAIQERSHEFV